MYGPAKPGKWSSIPSIVGQHQFLIPGKRYLVTRQFTDYDKTIHPLDEQWTFLGHSFAPYDDGMSFFVSLDGVQEWQLPLQWRRDEQADILDNLATYLTACPSQTSG